MHWSDLPPCPCHGSRDTTDREETARARGDYGHLWSVCSSTSVMVVVTCMTVDRGWKYFSMSFCGTQRPNQCVPGVKWPGRESDHLVARSRMLELYLHSLGGRTIYRTLSPKRPPFKIGIDQDPICERCLEEDELATHILCDCEAVAHIRFRRLG
jgi:hypothetical protein